MQPSSGSQTSSVWAAAGGRREPLRWTASASGLSARSERWSLRGLRDVGNGGRLRRNVALRRVGRMTGDGGCRPSSRSQTFSAFAGARGRREPLGWMSASASEVSASEVSAVHRLVYGWVTLRNATSGEWVRVVTGVSTLCSHESSFQSALYLFLQPQLSRRRSLLLAGAAGAGAPGGVFRDPVLLREVVFGCEIVAGVFVLSYKNLCAIFAPVRNNLRLAGVGRHVVVDTDHVCEERHGAEVEVMSCCSSLNARSMGEG